MNTEASFGQWLRRRRRAVDLTQAELARRIGCSVVTIRKLEADERRPSKEFAERLAECLDIAPDRRAEFVAFARASANTVLNLPILPEAGQPARASTTHKPYKLPSPLTRLLGREQDVAAGRNYLSHADVRLLTLIGPPGIGKTRLGIELATALKDAFRDGVCFVALAPISDPALVVNTIATALGLKETREQPLFAQLIGYLSDRQLLLLLDDFDRVLAAAPVVAEMLETCPRIKVLVTSRASLQVRGERQLPVPPLLLPNLARLPAADSLANYPSVALFVERAQAVKPDFRLSQANAQAVAEICAHLDGLPLAIELAAAWSKVLEPAELLARLNRRLLLLSEGPRDLPPRHRTLRAAIGWSYELLAMREQALLARLAVFVGSFTLAAAEAVCGAADAPRVEEAADPQLLGDLASLANKSLVIRSHGTRTPARFTLFGTIREYAWERLEDHGETGLLRQRHAQYYLALAEAFEPALMGRDQQIYLDEFEHERDNLRAAVGWALEAVQAETALRLCGALWRFWERRGYLTEGRKWLLAALSQPAVSATSALSAPGFLAARAKALIGAGHLAVDQGDTASAQTLFEEARGLYQQLGEERGIASSLYGLGIVARYQGEYTRAVDLQTDSLAIARHLGDRIGTYQTLYDLAECALAQGNYEQGLRLHEESLALKREQGDTSGIAWSLSSLAQWAEIQGDYERAVALYQESLRLRWQQGDKWGVAESLTGVAKVAAVTWKPERAARLFGAVEALLGALEAALSPSHYTRASYERDVAVTRLQLDEATYARLWDEGRQMNIAQAVAYALED